MQLLNVRPMVRIAVDSMIFLFTQHRGTLDIRCFLWYQSVYMINRDFLF